MTSLSKIVNEKKIVEPSVILEQLRIEVKCALNQNNKESINRDGMDIAVCCIDKKNNILKYSGANRPVYRIHENELIKYLPDKQPVATFVAETPFSEIELKIGAGDMFFMFTDGIIDQIGGAKDKKFSTKQFEKILLSNKHFSMNEMESIINKELNEWKGNNDQTDDITIIGFKI
jgi:serine phosphatase RsbU (regulator of sigma subunit)